MNFDPLLVFQILIIGFPKWIMAVQCGNRYHHDYGDNPFTAAVKKSDGNWVECFAMLLLPHGRVSESDLLVTSSECIDEIRVNITDGYVAAFDRGAPKFSIDKQIPLEARGLRFFELKNAVTFTPYIQPICVPSGPSPIPRNGTTLQWTHGMNGMYEIEAELVAHRECNFSRKYKPSRMFCIKADDLGDWAPTGTPYFTEVNGVNILWGLFGFWDQYGNERRYAFHKMVPHPDSVRVQNPGEQGYPHHFEYAPLEK